MSIIPSASQVWSDFQTEGIRATGKRNPKAHECRAWAKALESLFATPVSPLGASVWRDFVIDGDSTSGFHKPVKSEIRAWSAAIEELAGVGGEIPSPSAAEIWVDDTSTDKAKVRAWSAAIEVMAAHWYERHALPSGPASIVLDFIKQRFYDGVTGNAVLSDLLDGPLTVTESGLSLNDPAIEAIGRLLDAIEMPFTIVMEVSGRTASVDAGIVSAGADALLFQNSANIARSFINAVALNTVNTANWAGPNFVGGTFADSGRALALNIGDAVSDSQVLSPVSALEVGSFAGVASGGFLRTLTINAFAAPIQELQAANWPAPFLLPYAGNALRVRVDEKISAGNVLHFERTQAWSCVAVINVRQVPVSGAAIIFSNVAGLSGPFRGFEAWIDLAGRPSVRIMSAAFPGTNWIGAYADIDVCDGSEHVLWYTYDASSTAAGIKFYVDRVLIATVTEFAGPLNATIVQVNPFVVATQTDFEPFYYLNGLIDEFRLYNVVKDAAFVELYSESPDVLPPEDADCVLSYRFDESSGTTVIDSSSSGFNGTITRESMRVIIS